MPLIFITIISHNTIYIVISYKLLYKFYIKFIKNKTKR